MADLTIQISTHALSDFGKRGLAKQILQLLDDYNYGYGEDAILNDAEVKEWATQILEPVESE